jgi:N6-adenosine-specific RNA methylase IME4
MPKPPITIGTQDAMKYGVDTEGWNPSPVSSRYEQWEDMWRRPLSSVPAHSYAAILADPPWAFETYSGPAVPTTGAQPYKTLSTDDLCAMPIGNLAARDSVLFLWITWPMLTAGLEVIDAWGFKYKTCAFAWMKADGTQLNMFPDHYSVRAGMGYWTMSNSEVCLLATRGKPKRLQSDVRQGIIEPRREHSRKPDEIYRRIERLVAGPYLELFARQTRTGWDSWGNEVSKFNGTQRATGSAIDKV